MSRRRYISTAVSVDKLVKRLAMEAGDFAALLYTWMIPHADDYGILTGDPEELLDTVMPGRRDKDPEDVKRALDAMARLELIERAGNRVGLPPESFYKYQGYIPQAKRRTVPLGEFLSLAPQPAQTSEDRRISAEDGDDQRAEAEIPASPSPSPSLSLSGERYTSPPGAESLVAGGPADGSDRNARRRSRRSKDPPGPEALALAEHLADLIRRDVPTAVIHDGYRERWGHDFELMARKDKIPWPTIGAALEWAHADPFWRGNVLSAGALRDHWNQIAAQMQRGATTNGRPSGRTATGGRTQAFGSEPGAGDRYAGLAIKDDDEREVRFEFSRAEVPEARDDPTRAAT